MKIVIVNKHFISDLGGSEIQTHLVANELVKKKINVKYLNTGSKIIKTKFNYKIYHIGNNVYKLLFALYKYKPQIIYWRLNSNFAILGLLGAKLFNIPIIFASSSLKDLKSKILYTRFINFFDLITVNNKKFLKNVKSKNKIYIQNFPIQGIKKFNYKKRYVLWVSNIKRRKNLELYIKLSSKYSSSNVHFLCIGDIQDKDYDWLKKYKYKSKNFKFLSKMTPVEINGAMKSSLFHVTTEDYIKAGFSNTFIQACYQKKPTLSFNFDPGGFINKHKIGKFCNGSEKLFFNYFEQYLKNPKLVKKDGIKAYNFAKKEFDEDKIIKKIISTFKKLKK